MDESGNGGGTLHGVGQPDVNGNMADLPMHPAKRPRDHEGEKVGRSLDDSSLVGEEGGEIAWCGGFALVTKDAVHLKHGNLALVVALGEFVGQDGDGAHHGPEGEDAHHEAEISEAVADEGLVGGIGRAVAGVPEADEEVGTEADAFPEEKHFDEVGGNDNAGHREHEDGEPAEETATGGILGHVADGEDMNEEADAGDDEKHALGQRVEDHADFDGEAGDVAGSRQGDPVPGGGLRHPVKSDGDGDEKAERGEADRGDHGLKGQAMETQEDRDGGDERQQKKEPGDVHERART